VAAATMLTIIAASSTSRNTRIQIANMTPPEQYRE
jgi:hypothetical protein